ncbi:MAG: hypothetical protein Q8Q94_04615 [bacterium]|nr:hypothetical protein [bacterium]MDZ4299900.1 hypothetical protein [Candidatus Sungbacteria bacterium]
MEAPTIVKRTKEYMLIKIPLPRQEVAVAPEPIRRNRKLAMNAGEKRLWKALQ